MSTGRESPLESELEDFAEILRTEDFNGEKELVALSGQSLLLPQDEAFHPDATGLQWRLEQLSA